MKTLEKLLLCSFVCFIFTFCKDEDNKTIYYKVEEFEVIKENIKTNVDGGYHRWYSGNSGVYKICLSNDKDTIQEEYITNRPQRFYKGDSVYYNQILGCYYIKTK